MRTQILKNGIAKIIGMFAAVAFILLLIPREHFTFASVQLTGDYNDNGLYDLEDKKRLKDALAGKDYDASEQWYDASWDMNEDDEVSLLDLLSLSVKVEEDYDKPASQELRDFVSGLSQKSNTRVNAESVKSRHDADELLLEKCADMRYGGWFGILYEDINDMRTAEEYMRLFPEIYSLEVDYTYSCVYKNGIFIYYELDLDESMPIFYAERTDDFSYMNEEDEYTLRKIKSISNELGLSEQTDVEKVKRVHDYIVLNTAYDYHCAYGGNAHAGELTFGDESYSAYGLLKNNMAVCDGYAKCFKLFMKLNGIDCERITGGNHAWNQVCLDDEWYQIDCTWDDPISSNASFGHYADVPNSLSYEYFLLTDDVMYEDHTPEIECHVCTGKKYHLYWIKDYVILNLDDVTKRYEEQKDKASILIVYPTDAGLNDNEIIWKLMDEYNLSGYHYPSYEDSGYYVLRLVNETSTGTNSFSDPIYPMDLIESLTIRADLVRPGM